MELSYVEVLLLLSIVMLNMGPQNLESAHSTPPPRPCPNVIVVLNKDVDSQYLGREHIGWEKA